MSTLRSRILGIDLGTSTAVAARVEGGVPYIVRNQEGASTTPAIVERSAHDWFVGQPAKRLAVVRPRDSAWDFLRLLGRRLDSPEVTSALAVSPFEIVPGARGEASLRLGGETVHPATLVSLVLAKLKSAAEAETNEAVKGCVIAVPAPFHTGQRRLVAEAGRLAGFDWVRTTTATTTAVLSLPREKLQQKRVLALCDLGGGSLGVAVVEIENGRVEVLAREGESFLGGEDFDQLIVRWLMDEVYRREGIDASSDPVILAHLKELAEHAKCRLSVLEAVEIDVPVGSGFSARLTRAAFEKMLAPQLEWLASPCWRALKASRLKSTDIDFVLTLGGSTRIPSVLRTVAQVFGKEPTVAIHPEESPALGAAVLGGIANGVIPGLDFSDVQSHDLGIEYPRGTFAPIVAKGDRVPVTKSRVFLTRESRLEIDVLEGTSPLANECLSLGKIVWEMPFRRAETGVRVEIEVDSHGAIQVSAADPESGTAHRVPLRVATDLSASEAERCESEVERYRAQLLSAKVKQVTGTRALEVLDVEDKVVAALNGDRNVRLALVLDPDRSVWSAVLESPRTTAADIAAVASLHDVAPAVLRAIGAHPDWTKHYDVALALVVHPRTPAEIALKLVDRLRTPDLERVLASDNLSPLLRDQCRALMKMRI